MTTIGMLNGRLAVWDTPYLHKDVLKQLLGARWNKEERCWTFPPSSTSLEALTSLYPYSNLRSEVQEIQERTRRIKSAILSKTSSAESLPPIQNTAMAPWLHQLRSFHFASGLLGLTAEQPSGGGAMLALDMGCGKTKVVYDLVNNWNQIRTILVTCPISVVPTWKKECFKHQTGREISVLTLGNKEGVDRKQTWPLRARTDLAKSFLASSTASVKIVVINHESVWREPFKSFALGVNWDLLVVDECHRAKAPGGKFSRFLGNYEDRFRMRLGLTGTPMPNNPMDIYAQARFINSSIFGTSFTRFKARYGIWGGFEKRKLIGLQNEEEFNEKLEELMIRVTSQDALDLPPQVHERRTCALAAEERTSYNSMRDGLILQLKDGVVTAANALVKLLRLQQIVQGTVTDEEGREHRVGNSKQQLLEEVLEDLGPAEPVVVFCRFTDDLNRVRETAAKLGRPYAELSGKHDDLQRWQDGGAVVLGVQIQAGGVGVDFSRAAYTIYYSPTFDMGAYEQSLKRTHRPGQERTTFYYHLLAEGTIDMDIMRALESKKNVVESVLGGLL